MAVEKNLRSSIKLYKKQCLLAVSRKKNCRGMFYQKHMHWEKGFPQLLWFWWFVSRFISERVQKLRVYFGLDELSLDFQRKEDEMNTVYEKEIWFSTCRQLVWSRKFYIWDGKSTIKCLFWNANDSIVKLMVSITSGVSLWYRTCYRNMSTTTNYDNDNKCRKLTTV